MRGDHVVLATPEGYRGENVIARFWEIVDRFRVSMFSGVPTLYTALLEIPIGDNNLSSLKFAACRAAPMPAALIRAFETKTGVAILEGYGLTEGACVSSINPIEGEKIAGSIGLPIPYQRIAAVILDGKGRFQRFADTDEVEIIAINGPNVFSGYLDPNHNEGVFIEIGGERWLNTGDLGRRDSKGYCWLAGRRKELIIRSGHNIDPKIIEDALLNSSGRLADGGRREPRRVCRRIACSLCPAQARSRGHRGGPPGACGSDNPGEGGNPEADQDIVVPAHHGGWKAVQAGSGGARDRGNHSRRGGGNRGHDRVHQARP